MKIALLRERKNPPDERVALTPQQAAEVMRAFPGTIVIVQSSPFRCFKDEEYEAAGIAVQDDVSDADILLGIKEVPSEYLLKGKTYLFFSHTIKKQPYNRNMLREVLKQRIKLVDYECLVWENGSRILGFGRFAGIIGTYNGLRTWGQKFTLYDLEPAHELDTYDALKKHLKLVTFPPMKIALCGDGRVAHGSLELLRYAGFREVTREELVEESYNVPVFAHLRPEDFYARKDGELWDKSDFYVHPEEYESTFLPYAEVTDLMINAIYWHNKIPVFFTKENMKSQDFRIKVIADITCDIEGSIPCTVRATTIDNPVYGWHSYYEKETDPYLPNTVDIMAVGNLPCELPKDASHEFGQSLLKYIMAPLLMSDKDNIIKRATITENGSLTERYNYLEDYVA
ncbi:NAD(P)-dependent oxidoreductase [Oscillatoria amoena NRMC-F 0135]|nr:NAD(P)-dependent oxidoreductase [Oscillatoria amoena NRMC-F 0135]